MARYELRNAFDVVSLHLDTEPDGRLLLSAVDPSNGRTTAIRFDVVLARRLERVIGYALAGGGDRGSAGGSPPQGPPPRADDDPALALRVDPATGVIETFAAWRARLVLCALCHNAIGGPSADTPGGPAHRSCAAAKGGR